VRRSISSAAVACLALAAASPVHAATKVKRYSPWDADGNPVVKKYSHGSADCTKASRYNPRSDAWRCVSATVTLDPCFASPTGDDEVFCIASPFARQGSLLGALLEPSDHPKSSARSPWALQVGKRKCTYLLPRKGKPRRPTYRCGKSRKGPFLYGRPNTKRKNWTIRSARNSRHKRLKRVRIRAAWQ
jgi:hypothetical protein